MTTAEGLVIEQIAIRRTLRDGDAAAIAELHQRIYELEYGLNEQFTVSVEEGRDGRGQGLAGAERRGLARRARETAAGRARLDR